MTVFAGMFGCVTVIPMPITVFAVIKRTVSVLPLPDAEEAPAVTDTAVEQNATKFCALDVMAFSFAVATVVNWN